MPNPEIYRQLAQEPQKSAQGRSFQNVLDFLAEQVFPIELKTQVPPKHPNQTQENWERNLRITGLYLGTGPNQTLDEIGGDVLTRERIRQIVKETVRKIQANSNQEMQERFPLESFYFGKPQDKVTIGKRISKRHGNLPLKVGGAILKGQSLSEIRRRFGHRKVYSALHTLRKWGIEIPREKSVRERFASLANPELSDQEVQKILDTVTGSAYRYLSRGKNPILTKVSGIARSASLFLTSRDVGLISTVLKKAGIGVGFAPSGSFRRKSGEQIQFRYHFIRTLDTDRAVNLLKQAPEFEHLKTNPVAVLGRPSAEIPSCYKLQSGEFAAVMNLVAEIRGRRLNQKSRIKLVKIINADCPVSVYKRRASY